MITLGSNMELSGFGDFDPSTKLVIRKVVGNQVKKINDTIGDFDKLSLNLNKAKENNMYQLSGKIEVNGKVYTSDVSDLNLFFALSKVLNKLKDDVS